MMSKKVSQIVLLVYLLWMPIQSMDTVQGADMGPLHARQRYPLYLMFLTPAPDSPGLIEKGGLGTSLSIDYTSIYIDETTAEWSALMDMEMTVVDLCLTYGLTRRVNISLSLPWIGMNDGFLDNALADYHGLFGFPNYGKEDGPVDEFGYHITRNDDAWFDAQSGGLHLGDSVVSAKIQLINEKGPKGFASSLLLALKLPTGDEDHGFGSGRFDQGLILLNQYRMTPLILYLNPGFVFLSDPDTQGADIHVDDMLTLLAGMEFRVNDTCSLMGQFNFVTSPFHNTGIGQMDQDSLELALGFAISLLDDMIFEFAFSEDLTRTAPDFTVHGGIRYEFGS
jgi:Protein of unknown function (DUF3187)